MATRPTLDAKLVPMASFEDVVALTEKWPGVTVETWYGTPGLKVGGKGFCRIWSEREHDRDDVHDTEVLVVFGDIDEKQSLIAASGGVVFSTPHYDGNRGLLIRLDDVDREVLAEFVEDSYRSVAPKRVVAEFDASYH